VELRVPILLIALAAIIVLLVFVPTVCIAGLGIHTRLDLEG
jgi:hypothetical protein